MVYCNRCLRKNRCWNRSAYVNQCTRFIPNDDIRNKLIKSFNEEEKMKGKLKEGVKVPEGVHTGTIVEEELRQLEHKGNTIEYLDFKVTVDDFDDVESLKFGVPFSEEPTLYSKYGKLLALCGADLGDFDTEKDIIGKKIRYQTTNDDNGFARVIFDSIKLA